jgi:hypothetical protein
VLHHRYVPAGLGERSATHQAVVTCSDYDGAPWHHLAVYPPERWQHSDRLGGVCRATARV